MKLANFKCKNCETIIEIFVKTADDFPKNLECDVCEKGIYKRIFTPTYSIVHQGKVGNYNNGYTSSPVSIKKT